MQQEKEHRKDFDSQEKPIVDKNQLTIFDIIKQVEDEKRNKTNNH